MMLSSNHKRSITTVIGGGLSPNGFDSNILQEKDSNINLQGETTKQLLTSKGNLASYR